MFNIVFSAEKLITFVDIIQWQSLSILIILTISRSFIEAMGVVYFYQKD